jgi:hypothetical protein
MAVWDGNHAKSEVWTNEDLLGRIVMIENENRELRTKIASLEGTAHNWRGMHRAGITPADTNERD